MTVYEVWCIQQFDEKGFKRRAMYGSLGIYSTLTKAVEAMNAFVEETIGWEIYEKLVDGDPHLPGISLRTYDSEKRLIHHERYDEARAGKPDHGQYTFSQGELVWEYNEVLNDATITLCIVTGRKSNGCYEVVSTEKLESIIGFEYERDGRYTLAPWTLFPARPFES